MAGHIHTDPLHVFVLGTSTFLLGHVMRIIASYIGTKVSPQIGTAIGAFYSAPSSN